MKKIILFAFFVILSLGAFSISPDSKSLSENTNVPSNKENKMSGEETNNLTKRVEEVSPGKSKQTLVVHEGYRSRRDRDDMYGNHRGHGGVIFIGGGTVILLVILIIILV